MLHIQDIFLGFNMRDVQAIDFLESLSTFPMQNEPARRCREENTEAGEEEREHGLDNEGHAPGHGVSEVHGAITGEVACAYT